MDHLDLLPGDEESMSQHINDPKTIAYFGLGVLIVIIMPFIVSAIYTKVTTFKQRRHDKRIFKVAEEARRDFR